MTYEYLSYIKGSPAVIGCFDEKHIPITAMSVNKGDYVNRKSTLKEICDAAHIITIVEAKWPGSVHDSRIYQESMLRNRFAHGKWNVLSILEYLLELLQRDKYDS